MNLAHKPVVLSSAFSFPEGRRESTPKSCPLTATGSLQQAHIYTHMIHIYTCLHTPHTNNKAKQILKEYIIIKTIKPMSS